MYTLSLFPSNICKLTFLQIKDVPRPTDLEDEDYKIFMTNLRKVCDSKSLEESTTYLVKLGRSLERLDSVLDDNLDGFSTIWDTMPKQLTKPVLTAQQSYVEYKLKTFHQTNSNNTFTCIETVISLIKAEQILIIQNRPSHTKPVFQRSESSNVDVTNKKSKWW